VKRVIMTLLTSSCAHIVSHANQRELRGRRCQSKEVEGDNLQGKIA
jgi:hypothetical protein